MKAKNIIIILVVAAVLGLGGKFYLENRVVEQFKQEFEQSNKDNEYAQGKIGNVSYSVLSQTLTLKDIEFTPKDPSYGNGKLNIESAELSGINTDALNDTNIGKINLDTKILSSLTLQGVTLSDDWGIYSKKLFVLDDPRISQALLLFVGDPEGTAQANKLTTSYDVLEFLGNQIAFKKLLIEGAELNLKGEAGEELGLTKVSMDHYEIRDCANNMIGLVLADNIKAEGPDMKMSLKRVDGKDSFLFGNLGKYPEYIISGKFPKSLSSMSGLEITVPNEHADGRPMLIKLADAKFEQVFNDVSSMKLNMNGFEMPLEDFDGQIPPAAAKVLAENKITALNLDIAFDVQFDRTNEEVSLNKSFMNIKNVGSVDLQTKLLVKGATEHIRALGPVLQSLSANPFVDGLVGIESDVEPAVSEPATPLQPLLVSSALNVSTAPDLENIALKLVQIDMPQLSLEQFREMRKQQAASAVMLLSALQMPQLQKDVSAFIENLGSLEITVNPEAPVDLFSLQQAGPAELQKLNIKSVYKGQ